jgi:hypothetical protein
MLEVVSEPLGRATMQCLIPHFAEPCKDGSVGAGNRPLPIRRYSVGRSSSACPSPLGLGGGHGMAPSSRSV